VAAKNTKHQKPNTREAPTSKLQKNPKVQASKIAGWSLVIGISLDVGCWCLEFNQNALWHLHPRRCPCYIQFRMKRLIQATLALAWLQVGTVFGQQIDIPKIDVPKTGQTPIAPSPITTFPIQPVPIQPATVSPAPVPNSPITLFPVNPVPIQPAYVPSAPVYRLPSLATPGVSSGGNVASPTPVIISPPAGLPASTPDLSQTNSAITNSTSGAEQDESGLNDTNDFFHQLLRSSTNSPAIPVSSPGSTAPGSLPESPGQPTDVVPPVPPAKPDFIYPA
jgi:hypothetical protein